MWDQGGTFLQTFRKKQGARLRKTPLPAASFLPMLRTFLDIPMILCTSSASADRMNDEVLLVVWASRLAARTSHGHQTSSRSTLPQGSLALLPQLQTVPQDTLESAMIDGATRWQRVRYVVIPHLMPLAVFVTLIQLMDNFRVFEPILGFNAQANATSLSWVIYNDLRGSDGAMLFGSAAATSMLTIIGVCILLAPVVVRTWRANRRVA